MLFWNGIGGGGTFGNCQIYHFWSLKWHRIRMGGPNWLRRSVEHFSDVQKYFCKYLSLQNLFVDFKKSKMSKKVGVGKPMTSAPPLRFSRSEVLGRIWIYRFRHSAIIKKFLIFKIDVHTPGTKKSKKIALLLVKNKQKMYIFHYLWLVFGARNSEKTQKILWNILERSVNKFNVDRPVSAEIAILAYFQLIFFCFK